MTYPHVFCVGRGSKRTNCTRSVVLIDVIERLVAEEFRRRQLSASEVAELRVLHLLTHGQAEQQATVRRQERRLAKLSDQRGGLLEGYYAGAIPIDRMKVEQDRIARETKEAQKLFGACQADFDRIKVGLDLVLQFVQDCGGATNWHRPRCGG